MISHNYGTFLCTDLGVVNCFQTFIFDDKSQLTYNTLSQEIVVNCFQTFIFDDKSQLMVLNMSKKLL